MDRTFDVGSPCVGSLGLHHMLSNVWEWEANCMEAGVADEDADDDCRYRGTPYHDGGSVPECSWSNGDEVSPRDNKAYHVGFRCCWSSN
jgi:formylglycine-generating enzyme required for sulfatase activity